MWLLDLRYNSYVFLHSIYLSAHFSTKQIRPKWVGVIRAAVLEGECASVSVSHLWSRRDTWRYLPCLQSCALSGGKAAWQVNQTSGYTACTRDWCPLLQIGDRHACIGWIRQHEKQEHMTSPQNINTTLITDAHTQAVTVRQQHVNS